MKGFFLVSCTLHGALLAGMIAGATLLSKPRIGYYSVDLFSSAPAGTPGGGGVAEAIAPVPVSKPPVVPAPPVEEEERKVTKDAIKLGKPKKKLPPSKPVPRQAPARQAPTPRVKHEPKYTYGSEGSDSEGTTGGAVGIPGGLGGVGVSGQAGPSFPFPWYMKQIAEKLDKAWHPPHEFSSDTSCVVTFVISRSGDVSGTKIEKRSGDTLFDELAMRAVLYSNPLPPLPNGYDENTLNVHLTFSGKR